MSRKNKLYKRILNNQKNVSFEDFVLILEAFGFVHSRTNGSHFVYRHEAVKESVSIQSDSGQAKPYQIRQFLKLVEAYNLKMKTQDEDTSE